MLQETTNVPAAGGSNAAALQQMQGGQSGFRAGRFQRLGFRTIAVRLVEQLIEQRRELRGQAGRFQLAGHALDG